MYIRLNDTRKGLTAEILCDICGEPLDLDENCDYLTPRGSALTEAHIIHHSCSRVPGRFTNHWSQMRKPRHIIQQIAEQSRSPGIIDFLAQLAEDRQKRLAAKDK